MNDLQIIQKMVKEKLISNIVEGVGRFPIPSASQVAELPSNRFYPFVQNCQECSCYASERRAVVASSFEHKPFFVLSDFPNKEDSESTEVFSKNSPCSAIALNLLNKLEIQENCHFSYAIKYFPEKGLPSPCQAGCSSKNLLEEIAVVNPQIILCFGYRALHSLLALKGSLSQDILVENTSSFSFQYSLDKTTQLYFLSSFKDLNEFPHWRRQVWQTLSPLAKSASSVP
ncbi:hypothetical protein [Silvanigrella aquatica]|uniref:Uracil-DNA glycosylase-like domain-containing protein n=1 Tax=Silvanigrella aquatica TaxID=1915309 RepID=A0A1L4CZR6_9BACT|nr:hypothetical protein [Silvanigrella aquatica]APJ03436.1 hypothetical protein AXG55_05760 [Silvanigrella aquatica]